MNTIAWHGARGRQWDVLAAGLSRLDSRFQKLGVLSKGRALVQLWAVHVATLEAECCAAIAHDGASVRALSWRPQVGTGCSTEDCCTAAHLAYASGDGTLSVQRIGLTGEGRIARSTSGASTSNQDDSSPTIFDGRAEAIMRSEYVREGLMDYITCISWRGNGGESSSDSICMHNDVILTGTSRGYVVVFSISHVPRGAAGGGEMSMAPVKRIGLEHRIGRPIVDVSFAVMECSAPRSDVEANNVSKADADAKSTSNFEEYVIFVVTSSTVTAWDIRDCRQPLWKKERGSKVIEALSANPAVIGHTPVYVMGLDNGVIEIVSACVQDIRYKPPRSLHGVSGIDVDAGSGFMAYCKSTGDVVVSNVGGITHTYKNGRTGNRDMSAFQRPHAVICGNRIESRAKRFADGTEKFEVLIHLTREEAVPSTTYRADAENSDDADGATDGGVPGIGATDGLSAMLCLKWLPRRQCDGNVGMRVIAAGGAHGIIRVLAVDLCSIFD